MFCQSCGNQLSISAAYCSACGEKVIRDVINPEMSQTHASSYGDRPSAFSTRPNCTYTTKCFWICLCALIAIDIMLIVALTNSHMTSSFAIGYCGGIIAIQLLVAALASGVASAILKSLSGKTFLVAFGVAVAFVALGKIGMNEIQNGSISTSSQILQPNDYQPRNEIIFRPGWLGESNIDPNKQEEWTAASAQFVNRHPELAYGTNRFIMQGNIYGVWERNNYLNSHLVLKSAYKRSIRDTRWSIASQNSGGGGN